MKISLNWLKDYIPGLEFDSEESLEILHKRMISCGLDIESIEKEGGIYKNFVIGEVIEKKKHPDADKLSLCKVNTGEKILDIVCGAPNVEEGQKVCVAVTGAVIPNGGFEIKKSKIRGETSEGMICWRILPWTWSMWRCRTTCTRRFTATCWRRGRICSRRSRSGSIWRRRSV